MYSDMIYRVMIEKKRSFHMVVEYRKELHIHKIKNYCENGSRRKW